MKVFWPPWKCFALDRGIDNALSLCDNLVPPEQMYRGNHPRLFRTVMTVSATAVARLEVTMPGTMSDGDIVEVRINYVMSGQRLVNVFHYVAQNVNGDLDYEAAMDFALNEFTENLDLWPQVWDGAASESCEIYKVEAQRIFPSRSYHLSKLVTIPGTIAESVSPSLPQNVQLSLTKVTDDTGRGKTGRVEVPGAVIDSVADGRLSADGIVWMNLLADSLQQDISMEMLNTSVLAPVVLNRFAPAGSPLIQLVRVQETVRVEHRRTVGVGE